LDATVVNGTIHTADLVIADLVQTSLSLTGTLGNGAGEIELWTGNGDINVIGFD
jgi:hypothetical protein